MLADQQSLNLYTFLSNEVTLDAPDVATDLLQEYSNIAAFDLSAEQHDFFKKIFAKKSLDDPESLKAASEWKKLQKTLRELNQQDISINKKEGLLKTASQFINSLLMQHSFDYFLLQSYKQCAVLGLSHKATLNLMLLIADRDNPIKINEFIKLLQKDIVKTRSTLELSFQNCDCTSLLKKENEDEHSQQQRLAKLRQIILDGLQNSKPLVTVIKHLSIVESPRFSRIESSFKEFEREILLQQYGERALDLETKEITSFAQSFLQDKVSAETFKASLKLLAGKNIKNSSMMPIPQQIELTDKAKIYELVLLEPNNPRNLYLGDLTNCCLKAGGDAERCIVDALTKPTSGMYVVQEKKAKKVCAAAYSFISETGNLVFDSIEPLNQNKVTEYAKICQKLFRQFAVQVLELNPNINRVCVGSGGNTSVCFDLKKEIIQENFLEKTQKGTMHYDDSVKVFVLAHSDKEEQRLNTLANAILSSWPETFDSIDKKLLVESVKKAILTYSKFYKNPEISVEECIAYVKNDRIFKRLLSEDIEHLVLSDKAFQSNVIIYGHHSQFEFLLKKNSVLLHHPEIISTIFYRSTKNDDSRFIETALSYGCSPNTHDWLSALEDSVKYGSLNMAEWLIKEKAVDPNMTNQDLLYVSIDEKKDAMTSLLLELGTSPNRCVRNIAKSPLVLAVITKNKPIVDMLLAKGADISLPQGALALLQAANTANKDIFYALLEAGVPFDTKNKKGQDIYASAIEGYNFGLSKNEDLLDFVKTALNYEQIGKFSNKSQESALIQAIRIGHTELAIFLIQQRHYFDKIEDYPSNSELLNIAIDCQNVKFLEKFMETVKDKSFLLKKNERGETPLMQALVKYNMTMAQILCSKHPAMVREIFFQDVLPNNQTEYVAQLLELDKTLLAEILKDQKATEFLEQLIEDPQLQEQIFSLRAKEGELEIEIQANLERLEQLIQIKSSIQSTMPTLVSDKVTIPTDNSAIQPSMFSKSTRVHSSTHELTKKDCPSR